MKRLAEVGIHGCMLHTLVSMYMSVPVMAKCQGQLGEPFQSTCGVKQGDPLSPLLFGIFMDEFEQWAAERLPAVGVPLGEARLKLLLFADDLVLMSDTPEGLQQLLDALHEFLVKKMEVNLAKTEIRHPRSDARVPEPTWSYAEQHFQVSWALDPQHQGYPWVH
jgi:hypothetical protein